MSDTALKGKPQDSHKSPGAPFGGNNRARTQRKEVDNLYPNSPNTSQTKRSTQKLELLYKRSQVTMKRNRNSNKTLSTHSSQRRTTKEKSQSQQMTKDTNFLQKEPMFFRAKTQIQSQSFTSKACTVVESKKR